ncbi:hypothetical protein Gohar_020722 [Gossypium harknessii]|uniref:Uncharacterized protein n=1 Tax=Gossypium harknessii TaxID=34285 RepID=A0A7J9HYI9_9ROSI|nr:hypothetical protein [Gossypium harknessii]
MLMLATQVQRKKQYQVLFLFEMRTIKLWVLVLEFIICLAR